MIGRIIVLLFCVILIISVLVSLVGIIIDLTNKITFDAICSQALKQADLNGGLSKEKQLELIAKLQDNAFVDINVYANEKVQYKDLIRIKVTSSKKSYGRINVFAFKEGRKTFVFNKEIVSRKIHNSAE